jgi:phosphoglycolate phosphatase-like HAD superfamily hydrolase
MLAGKAAQVAKVVGITHGFNARSELETAGADAIIDSLDQLPPFLNDISD